MRAALVLLALGACTFARVRYHDGAERSAALACYPAEDDPHALECFDYVEVRLRQRSGQVKL